MAQVTAGCEMTYLRKNCAIPGSTRLSHLIDNQAAGRGRLPDESMRRRMEAFWDNKSA